MSIPCSDTASELVLKGVLRRRLVELLGYPPTSPMPIYAWVLTGVHPTTLLLAAGLARLQSRCAAAPFLPDRHRDVGVAWPCANPELRAI